MGHPLFPYILEKRLAIPTSPFFSFTSKFFFITCFHTFFFNCYEIFISIISIVFMYVGNDVYNYDKGRLIPTLFV